MAPRCAAVLVNLAVSSCRLLHVWAGMILRKLCSINVTVAILQGLVRKSVFCKFFHS